MTVPQEVKLARHAGDLDDDGHDTYGGGTAAAAVTVADTGALFAGTNVEAVLQELGKKDIGYLPHGPMGAAMTFSALIGAHSGEFDANCTFTFSGATSGLTASIILRLASDGTSVPTWPGSVVWAGGSEPTLTTTPGEEDILVFFTWDGGTTWYGGLWGGGSTSGRWELAVITGSPPDPLYADGDYLYILVP